MDGVVHFDWDPEFFRATLDEADIAVLVISHAYEVIYANRYLAERIAGMPQSAMIGMSLPREKTLPDEEMERVVEHTRRVLEQGVAERIENWALHKDGSRRLMYWSSVPAFDDEGKVRHLVAVGMDVTEQRKEKHQLENLAHRDALTDLYNRTFFERRLPEDVLRAKMEGVGLALLYIDLDCFKPVNDQHGHEAGDAVLREVAARLRKGLRQNDIVCRIGGDEFAVILYGISSRDDVGMIVAPMIERLAQAYDIKGICPDLGASVGIAFLDDDVQNSQELLRKADAAMYRAKQAGKGRFAFAD
ncbi:MAG: GGDEF domain-containing protein [Gammaproteobacteria bacterium]|nr:GGDEF domain-containing protein [Gammaproteobacteria bacterium]MBU1777521.1 GGDEF domain-containing protein [Gammaproteobacteria bacterium]MBU1967701.1 GGDEF domain-containing protein [Gammaproteobacteria bacterium]